MVEKAIIKLDSILTSLIYDVDHLVRATADLLGKDLPEISSITQFRRIINSILNGLDERTRERLMEMMANEDEKASLRIGMDKVVVNTLLKMKLKGAQIFFTTAFPEDIAKGILVRLNLSHIYAGLYGRERSLLEVERVGKVIDDYHLQNSQLLYVGPVEEVERIRILALTPQDFFGIEAAEGEYI